MWSYYGSKSKIVKLYPRPVFDEIREPFAGSARYSLEYFEKDVWLIDKYEAVVKIWKWLQRCSEGDILGLPKLTRGMDLRTLNISEEERLFLGMLAGVASVSPRNKVSYFAAEQNSRKNRYKRIAEQLFKIRHWKIQHGDYTDMPNAKATWFIDVPYEFGGQAYVHNNKQLDFKKLSEWSVSREGQVIVCENMRAKWLPFSPLCVMRGANQKFTTEAMWTNRPAPSYQQQALSL